MQQATAFKYTSMEGRSLRERLFKQAVDVVAKLKKKGVTPTLHVVLVGDDPASEIYVDAKMRAANKVGINAELKQLPSTITQVELDTALEALSKDEGVHGILLQLPLPKGLKKRQALNKIAPHKDVDGLTTHNMGVLVARELGGIRPCTPLGIMRLLKSYNIDFMGKQAVVVGRSQLVGRPVAELLAQAGATVTTCQRHTPDISEYTKQADILVVATGVPSLITSDMIKPGAAVVDVGITRLETGEVVGDCDLNCRDVAGLLSPVPGGVGPMTVATLMTNTIDAALKQNGEKAHKWELN
ncbi:MAG: bifunctional methylenetetrahydrofolate dehydrogenase/methenyltetrahydrofolate cyclohydrolase [Magnetococcales bacterium]|jgi:methylenetetrahydrofolate dehydrogenase (NADP+)/methenyltetrahydrofolate cyclohydrolase|nr:bifunctional methylenetetrahydrofolate dehydrogenase/methenyltetrahydrofolate cyclohydrolase [Magnetococcales bacterium]|tara:strand:+ start:40822 stop:41718 length:897 start_codon:yes stop_codon:yes gene_type:complete